MDLQSSAGAASAPAGGQGQSFNQSPQAGGGEAAVDRGELHKLQSEFQQSLEGVRRESAADREILQRVKSAFGGDDRQSAHDPIDQAIDEANQKLDFYIQKSLTPEGRAMQHTMAIAVQSLQTEIAQLKGERASQGKIKALEQKLNQLSNPEYITDQTAYSQLDQMILKGITQIFGSGDESFPIRKAQYDAVCNQVTTYLKDLQAKAPQKWAEAKRSPEMMRYIVDEHLKRNLPPKAKQILEQEQIKNWEPTADELRGMILEAKQKISNPEVRQKTIQKLRADLWEAQTRKRRR